MKRSIGILTVLMMFIFTCSRLMSGAERVAGGDKDMPRADLYDQVELFSDAVSIIRTEYAGAVDFKKLMYGAMQGMLESLDDYSQFMDPDEYNEIKVETKGEFGGIGIETSLKDGILTVVTPMVGGPAESRGIRAGDKIVKIDGKVTKNIKLNDAVKQMRGKPGTTVTLTVWREGLPNILEIPIKRTIINTHSVKRSEIIGDGIGYIKLVEFQENTAHDLDSALKKLKAGGMDSLVLDLRNNPGGILDGAVSAAERFLAKDDVVVSIRSRVQDQDVTIKAGGGPMLADIPMIVMVNEGSASASEIVAGAIKDNRRGIILGAKTFGKASVQTVIPLKDGSALKFTTAHYLTPNGRPIGDDGILPDVVIENVGGKGKKAASDIDVFDELDEKEKEVLGPVYDNQLDAAVNLMKAIKIYRKEEKG